MSYAHYSVYDRYGEKLDFVDDEDTEHYLEYDKQTDCLTVRQWSSEHQGKFQMPPIIAQFFNPSRYTKDVTL